jgi:hypothetical protein
MKKMFFPDFVLLQTTGFAVPLHPSKSLFFKIAVVFPKSHEEKNIF